MAQEPIQVERPGATPPPTPSPTPDPEVAYKARLKEQFGSDDLDEIKRWRAEADEGRQYKEAFGELQRRAAQAQQQAQQGPPQSPQGRPPDMAKLREYARVDPMGAYLELERYKDAHHQARYADLERRTVGQLNQQEFDRLGADAERYVRAEYPEVYDKRTALHKAGQEVYASMPELQQRGDGFRIATEIAAAREGIAPKSRRRNEPTADRDELTAQSLEKGTKKPSKGDATDDVVLTPADRKKIADFNLDEKVYKQAKAARAQGKNLQVK